MTKQLLVVFLCAAVMSVAALASTKITPAPIAPLAANGPYTKAPALGIRLGSLPHGRYDAITDVAGVKVGQVTHIDGSGKLVHGVGPVRTGVTAIIPRDDIWHRKVFAAAWPFNGNGEMTGTIWVNEAGFLEVPILLTDTLSVGRVGDGVVSWMIQQYPQIGISDDVPIPVVAECDDGLLNDQQGRHNQPTDAVAALNSAAGGPVAQGSVGAGTGMFSFGFKGGIGTASRVLRSEDGGYTVGVLVNTNMEQESNLVIDGVPVGQNIKGFKPILGGTDGSIVIIIATNAPLLPDQLMRVARRAALGLGRTGALSRTGSGDLVLAFSTGNLVPHYPKARTYQVTAFDLYHMTPLFDATVEATQEAVINALLAGKTMVGRDNNKVYGLPHDQVLQIMRRYGR